MASAAVFLAAFGLFLASASPTVSFEDTGELAVAASCLGVTHPPGYPWLVALGSLMRRLPAGDPGFRLAVLSALCAAATVAMVFAHARRLAGRLAWGGAAAAAAPWAAAIALAGGRTFWWQAGIGEKYALSVCLLSCGALALLRARLDSSRRGVPEAAFLCGLALSHHLHGLYLIPAGLALAWSARLTPRAAAACLLLAGLPLAAKPVAVAVRAAADPPLNWGLPDRADRLTWYLSARQYRFIMGSNKGVGEVLGRALRHVTVLPLVEYGPALALAAPGLHALHAAGTGLLPGAGLLVTANLWFAVAYNTPEIERYYLLSYALLALLMGLGAGAILRRSRPFGVAALAAVALIPRLNADVSPRTRHYLAWDFAVNLIAPLPRNAMLICEGDDQAFPLFYARDVRRLRPDVTLLPMPFACWEPSYRRLPAHLPGLTWPAWQEDPGRHLPALIMANAPAHPAYYTPGCSGAGSEGHLAPRGVVYAAFVDPADTARARRDGARFPVLRLRGAVDAERYRDPVTRRAVANYGLALAYHGASLLEKGRPAEAERHLAAASRLPLAGAPRAAALTHLGMCRAAQGDLAAAERRMRAAVAADPAFGPGWYELARVVLAARGAVAEARGFLERAAAHPELLTPGQRAQLGALRGRLP